MPLSAADRFAFFQETKIEAVAQPVNDAGLRRRLWEHRDYHLGEAFQAVDDRDQHIIGAARS